MILRPGTLLQDRYEILEKIGSGGMSDVFKALCHKLNRPVAIKLLKHEFSSDSSFVSKFKMEAQAAACLSHPNIVNIYDVVDEGDLHYIVMELIEGITLKSYISKKGCLDGKEAIGIAIQVAQGIAAAHEQGIIHRDIKPQNIIIARDGKVKVADFGIARAASTQTLSATAVGSVHYISPEQARGGYSDGRSDVYSLGITIYEMVTGRVPFQGDNTVTIALAHIETLITPPSYYSEAVPVSLENIILKCTEKKPEYRYGSMKEVVADLRHALVDPNGDFVKQSPKMDDSQTLIIGKPELEQIRSGRKVSVEPSREDAPGEDISPRIEKLLTAAGIIAAIIFVIVLIIVFAKVGGFFRSSTPNTTEASVEKAETVLDEKSVKMPDVVGLTTEIAEQKLKDSGSLYMKISNYVYSDTVPEGDIVSQDPVINSVIDKYSAVYVVVSKGPEHVAVNLDELGLENREAKEVKSLLESKGLVVAIEEGNSEGVEEGNVISYSPKDVVEGDTVTIVVSVGPSLQNPVTVPDLVGHTWEVAEEMLSDVGLVEGIVTERSSETIAKGIVISQSELADSQVESGAKVNLVISSGSAKQENYRYLASIDKSYPLQNMIGPGSGSTELTLKIQLRQHVGGRDEIRELMGPVTMTGDQILPVSFKNIEGAYGVTGGTVEIVNVETGEVINTYSITFIPIPQS